MKLIRKAALFGIGGGAYVGLEILYRGYSHISMFAAGGVCFLALGRLRKRHWSRAGKAFCGAGMVTAVELVTGLLVNRDFHVWDYRHQWGNFLGQICPLFTAVWVPVTVLGMGLYGLAERGLDRVMERKGDG